MSSETTVPPTPTTVKKPREAVFDVAKGIGILLVLGHHISSNSARLYTTPHSIFWWLLQGANRILSFSVPVFLLISAVLSARGLVQKPEVLPFYRRRLPAILWPYLVWTIVYWAARLTFDPNSRKLGTSSIFGMEIHGPSLLIHIKERLLDLVWGKAYFHLYFLVVLLELIILLPAAVRYVRWRKPSFLEVMATAFMLQASILIAQHYLKLMPYPGSNALWYIGSLLPGAWIGANWDLFREKVRGYVVPLLILSAVTLLLFLWQEYGVIHGIEANNYISNGSLTVYASCLSVVVLFAALQLAERVRWRKFLDPLGRHSLQIYLIHPAIMQAMENHRVVAILKPTYLGVILSPVIMLLITFGLIRLFRATRLEKPLFGRG